MVVPAESELDVGAGQVGSVLLQMRKYFRKKTLQIFDLEHRLVADGLSPTVQERRGSVVPTGSGLI